MYITFAIIYVVLSVVFIADVLRQPSTALSGAGKFLWILALLVVPVFVGGLRHLAHASEPRSLEHRV